MTNQTTIILFGASGDLAKRKLIPALYNLFIDHHHSHEYIIIGTALSVVPIQEILSETQSYIQRVDKVLWSTFSARCYYTPTDCTNPDDFILLKQFVDMCEQENSFINPNRLFYLATGSQFFCSITHNIDLTGLMQKQTDTKQLWHRIVYEKPFGHDESSAHAINHCIQQSLDESQVYRIDHYLTKEIVSNIAMIRFSNIIFEPLWSNRYIEHIQIVLSESIGIEDRGLYYDSYGAIRDVVQNHMLELVALVCMDAPAKLTGDSIKKARLDILKSIQFEDGIIGQCDQYTKEKHIAPDSTTETYAALKVSVNNARWKGVPIFLKTGKYLDKKETAIYITFKNAECLLTQGCPLDSNVLTIKIAPEAIFSVTLNAKKPGSMDAVVPVNMEFCHSCIFGIQTWQAYEILLQEVIKGEASISVGVEEIEYAWRLTDTILSKNLTRYLYKKGSTGPQEAEDFAHKHSIRWQQ